MNQHKIECRWCGYAWDEDTWHKHFTPNWCVHCKDRVEKK